MERLMCGFFLIIRQYCSCLRVFSKCEYLVLMWLVFIFPSVVHSNILNDQSVKPLKMTPTAGSFEGGQLIFIDMREPSTKKGQSSVVCRFGLNVQILSKFDNKSNQYVCRVPPHSRPEPVSVTIIVNDTPFEMPERYVYTTHGKYDAPVTDIYVERLQQRLIAVRKKISPSVKLCAVLKNGNPAGWLGKAMEDTGKVDYFCVPRMQDGIALRKAGIKKPIMVMYLTPAEYVPLFLYYELEPAAFSLSWVQTANELLRHSNHSLNVHLWIDTGISREGVMPKDALSLARAIHNSPKLHLQGIATHFCCLDEDDLVKLKQNDDTSETVLQKQRFDQAVKEIRDEGMGLDAIIHATSSDGLRYGLTPVYYDMLRMGTMLFENPLPKQRNYSWKTKILQVKTLPKGWCVDYECDQKIEKDTRVGIVAHIPDDEVTYTIRGKEVQRLLDHEVVIVLDISHLPNISEGEEVTMIFSGDDSPLDTSYSAPTTLK